MAKISPYIRIVRASKAGRGVVISAEECRLMAMDDAISTHAYRLQHPEIDEGDAPIPPADKEGERS